MLFSNTLSGHSHLKKRLPFLSKKYMFYLKSKCENLKDMCNNKYCAIKIAIALNLFFLLVCYILGVKFFMGLCDDVFMARILEGAYGDSYNVRMTFVNVLYGYALLPLYYLFPKISWYYVGEVFAVFISFTVLSYVIIKKMGLQWGSVFSFIIIACFARDFYLTLQFTQCAAALGAVGVLLFVYGMDSGFSQKKILVLSFVLMLWGYCMRTDAFLMGLPFFAFVMLFYAKKVFAYRYRFVLCVAVILFGLCGAKYFNDIHYSASDYQKYLNFQPTRVMLGDKENYDKDAVYEEVEESGLYGEDYSLLRDWLFYDKEVFSPDSLKLVTAKIAKYTYPLKWSENLLKVLYRLDSSLSYPCCWAFCLIGLSLICFRERNSLYVWGAFAILLAEMCYLVYLMRLVYRVEVGIWFYATVLAVPLTKNIRPIPCRLFKVVLGVIIAAYTVSFFLTSSFIRSNTSGHFLNVSRQEKLIDDYQPIFRYMDSLPNNTVFMMPMNTYQTFSRCLQPLYVSVPIGSWKRMVSFGFWTPYFPDVEKSLTQYGIENPMRNVVKENVVVVSPNEFLLDYLRRHYYGNVNVDTLRDMGGLKFFKYSEGRADD